MLSRNSPVALVIGAAGFIGSHLSEKFLSKKIQVVGVDDYSTGSKANLEEAVRHRGFHVLNLNLADAQSLLNLELPRLDYAIFLVDQFEGSQQSLRLIDNFISLAMNAAKQEHELRGAPKLLFVSSIDLYSKEVDGGKHLLKDAESYFARKAKEKDLNARVARLSSVFGPRMHFREDDPVVRLIQSTLNDEIHKESTVLDFSTRAVFVDAAAELLVKVLLSGGTADKIYDGCLINPYKVSEIKQILLDPMWYEMKHFEMSELPPWPTPNLTRTVKELAWKPGSDVIHQLKETIHYFKERNIEVPKVVEERNKPFESPWAHKSLSEALKKEEPEAKKGSNFAQELKAARRSKRKLLGTLVGLGLIGFGIFYPVFDLSYGVLTIRQNLRNAASLVESGEFEKATSLVNSAESNLLKLQSIRNSLTILQKLDIYPGQLQNLDELIDVTTEGFTGVKHALAGAGNLFLVTKVISGEKEVDVLPIYQNARVEFDYATESLSRVILKLQDPSLTSNLPSLIKDRVEDLKTRLEYYRDLAERAKVATALLPEITSIDGKRSYLIVLQDNLELRPSGGVISSFARLEFEKGRVSNISVEPASSLDAKVKDELIPPVELKNDLSLSKLTLKDSTFSIDYPSSARSAQFVYSRVAGDKLSGVFALDLDGMEKLLAILGEIELPEYGIRVNSKNLKTRVIEYAQKGESDKFSAAVLKNVLNKLFFLSNNNWAEIVSSLDLSLSQKHLLIYLNDPKLLSFAASANWAGILPRQAGSEEGRVDDFLSFVESNIGQNKANYNLERSFNIESNLSKELVLSHTLKVNMTNQSLSESQPFGSYKARIKMYLPSGARVDSASFKKEDITEFVVPFSDFGRSGLTFVIELAPKEKGDLIVKYSLGNPLKFKDGGVKYYLNVFKQPGTKSDSLVWKFKLPENVKINSGEGQKSGSSLEIVSDLSSDKSFFVNLTSN